MSFICMCIFTNTFMIHGSEMCLTLQFSDLLFSSTKQQYLSKSMTPAVDGDYVFLFRQI